MDASQERQLLVEEQKSCRARARKLLLETKRRIKALDERQKQSDFQEQRLRQNILQQRKQQIQDATDRFQRIHLPPSQRYRQYFRRNGPNIEDAPPQIQGKLCSTSRQSSVLSSNSHVSRTLKSARYQQVSSASEDARKFFYDSYINSSLGTDGGLTQERQLLVEEQKSCRVRARKFSLETNRRRKALDERQKQSDFQEQRLRQNILQRRKQQIQDATDRFQRAHLPPSQRYRQYFEGDCPNIEDALAQIQGNLSSYSRQSSVLFSNSHVSRSCTPSPKPPTVSKCSHRQALSAVEDYTKLLQEQTMTCFRNSQQTEKTQERQQDHSPQENHPSICCNSESLSTKVSLENEDPHQSTKNLQCSHSSIPFDAEESKSMSGDNACGSGSGHLTFAKQVALAIRDSVELTRGKNWKVESNNIVKKLRWFDEVDVEKEDNKQDMIKQIKNKSLNLCQSSNNSEDHLCLTTVSGAYKLGSIMTPPASTGYPFTKQAWADVWVQVSLPQEQVDEVKVPWSSTRTDGPKVPWRERPARAAEGPVSSRTRKGTVVRPQSATEVYQIAKTQGRVMVPRPPPRMESVEKKQNEKEKTYIGSGRQEPQACNQRRGMMHNKKGLCLSSTPTDEEISQLWHGVRNALTTKDAKNKHRRQALASGRDVRKPCMEQSRQPPGSRNRRFPQPSQPTKQTAVPVQPFSRTYNKTYPDEGLESPAQVHLAEVQQQGLTTISLEEQRILLSLDRLNHQLYGVQDHLGVNTDMWGSTMKEKATNQHKQRASSASNCTHYQRRV